MRSPRGCTTTASASRSWTTSAEHLYVVVEVPSVEPERPLGPRRRSSAISAEAAPWRARIRATKTARASATRPRASRSSTTSAASACSRRGPASASRSATWCRRCAGRRANGERTVVSTNTINLQEQLVGKDLPFLSGGARRPAGALRAAQGVAQLPLPARGSSTPTSADATLFDEGDARGDGQRLAGWASKTTDGSLSDLAAQPRAGSVGRGRGGARPLPALQVPVLRQVLRVQGATRGRRGRRHRGEPPPAAVGHRRPARITQNWDDAAVLPRTRASSSTKGIISRTRPRNHLGITITRRGLAAAVRAAGTARKGLLPTLVARLNDSQATSSAWRVWTSWRRV